MNNLSKLSRLAPFLIWLAVLALGWVSVIPENFFTVITIALLYGSMATAWNIHALSGVTSLGHGAFFGLGAYGFALAVSRFTIPPWMGIALGALCAATYGLIWVFSIDRLRHGSFVLATFVSVEIPRMIIENMDSVTNGSTGITNLKPLTFLSPIPDGFRGWYVLNGIIAGLLIWFHHKALSSVWGLGLRAMRDDERAALAIGVPVNSLRRSALLLSSFFTGVCGAMYASMIGFVEPSVVFGLHFSAVPLIFSLFGGKEQTFGPLSGAVLLYSLDQFVMVPLFPEAHRAIYGIALFVTLWLFPKGILVWTRKN